MENNELNDGWLVNLFFIVSTVWCNLRLKKIEKKVKKNSDNWFYVCKAKEI